MKIYKLKTRKSAKQPHWDDVYLLIVAADYASAVDKAQNYRGTNSAEICSVEIFGETTSNKDVFVIHER